ncbi:patatin-like phospholipase family protein [Bacillus cereus]
MIFGGGQKHHILLEEKTTRETVISKPIHKYFDLIAGTSTGGISALGLANDIPVKNILDLYLKRDKNIFGRRTMLFISRKY